MVDAPERIWAAKVTDNYGEWQISKDGLPRPVEYVRAEAAERLAGARVKVLEEPPHLTEYEIQVLLGTSISGCNMRPDRVFSLDMAWHRLRALELIDRADGLAIITEKGQDVVARILSALAEPAGEAEPVAWKVEWGFRKGPDVAFAGGGTGIYEDEISADKHIEKLNAYDGTDWVRKTPLYTTPPDASAIREALEPFARLAAAVFRVDDGREMNSGRPDDASIWGFDSATITYGDLRRVRSAIAGAKP